MLFRTFPEGSISLIYCRIGCRCALAFVNEWILAVMKRFLLLSLGCLAVSSTACAWIDDVGNGESSGTLDLTASEASLSDKLECVVKQFPLKFYDFDADSPFDGYSRIRMYRMVSESLWENYLFISFEQTNAETLETCPEPDTLVGQEIEVSANGCVRAAVQINACSSEITARLKGTLKLTEYSLKRGKRITGTIQGTIEHVETVQSTTETFEKSAPIGSVEGEFSFVNHKGAVWRH